MIQISRANGVFTIQAMGMAAMCVRNIATFSFFTIGRELRMISKELKIFNWLNF